MDTNDDPKLLLPFLRPLYEMLLPFAWPLVRCTVGVNLIVHGHDKLIRTIEIIGGAPPGPDSLPWLIWLMIVEFFAGIAVTLGMLTRLFATLAALELFHLAFIFRDNYSWRSDGFEYVLAWGLILVAVAIRGGGPYSLDRRIGWTL